MKKSAPIDSNGKEKFFLSRKYFKNTPRNIALKRANENAFSQAFSHTKKDEKFPVSSKDLSVL